MIEQHKPTTPVSQLRPIELPPEQPIDVGRYANALRRSKLLIATIVIAVTAIVLLLSLALPKTYSADATIPCVSRPGIGLAPGANGSP